MGSLLYISITTLIQQANMIWRKKWEKSHSSCHEHNLSGIFNLKLQRWSSGTLEKQWLALILLNGQFNVSYLQLQEAGKLNFVELQCSMILEHSDVHVASMSISANVQKYPLICLFLSTRGITGNIQSGFSKIYGHVLCNWEAGIPADAG